MTRPIGSEMTVSAISARTLIAAAAVAVFALLAQIVPVMAQSAEGFWLTEAGPRQAKVELSECGGGGLCAKIVWLKTPNDDRGKPLRDMRNKDESKRGRPILGMSILSNLQRTGQQSWQGSVYNPEDGNTYKAHFTLVSKTKAQLKGCAMFGMVCGEKIWTRTEPEKPKLVAKPKVEPKPKEEPKPVEPVPAAAEPDAPTADQPPAPSEARAPVQSDEVPAELWMDPAAVEPQPGNPAQPPAVGPQLESSIDPAVPNAPTLDAPQQPQLRGAAIDRLAPAQEPQPQPAEVPVPEQKPEVQPQPEAQPEPASKSKVVNAKPKPKARQRRQRKKEVLPWLAE